MFSAAGLSLLRISAQAGYSPNELRSQSSLDTPAADRAASVASFSAATASQSRSQQYVLF